jgi:hypothetical protein
MESRVCWGPSLITIWKKKLFNMRQILGHASTPGNYRKLVFWWYRLQNSQTVRYIDLKFDMGVVFEKLEDVVHVFLPGNIFKIYFFRCFECYFATTLFVNTFWQYFPKNPHIAILKSTLITCILKKNLVKIRLPYQKLLNFGKKKSNFPTVRRVKK